MIYSQHNVELLLEAAEFCFEYQNMFASIVLVDKHNREDLWEWWNRAFGNATNIHLTHKEGWHLQALLYIFAATAMLEMIEVD